MIKIDQDQIKRVLFGDEDPEIRHQFIESYSSEIEEFCCLMEKSFRRWSELDKLLTVNKDEKEAYISALLYTALHSHVVALKLFISGLMVAAGNTQRYVIECIALSLLFSRPSLGIIDRYMNDQYSTSKAIRDLVRNHEKLKLNRDALKVLKKSSEFYNKFSHPSRLSLGAVVTFDDLNSTIVLGGVYDPAKDFAYRRELESKVRLAAILPNIIDGIEVNYKDDV